MESKTEKIGEIKLQLNDNFYLREIDDKVLPYPRVTWITGDYIPKGIGFMRYLSDQVESWEQGQRSLGLAATRGLKVHYGCHRLLQGAVVSHQFDFSFEPRLKWEDHFEADEWRMVSQRFPDFIEKAKPVFLATEFTVYNDDDWYAGTADILCQMNPSRLDKKYPDIEIDVLVDIKSSKNIYLGHRCQVAAYRKCLKLLPDYQERPVAGGVLVLDAQTKAGWKFEFMDEAKCDYYYGLFLHAKAFWLDENVYQKDLLSERDLKPKEIIMPRSVQLTGDVIEKTFEKSIPDDIFSETPNEKMEQALDSLANDVFDSVMREDV